MREEEVSWLKDYEFVAVWLEGIALVAIFVLDWCERRDQRKERRQQHRETAEQLSVAIRSADAAKASADAFINSERAWVMADIEHDSDKWSEHPKRNGVRIVSGSGAGGDTICFYAQLVCRNEGRSPAWIDERRARFEIVDSLPTKPSLESAQFVEVGPTPLGSGSPPHKDEWTAIAKGHIQTGQMAVVYGIVNYRDIFGRPRQTTFGYRITPSNELRRLEGEQYQEYNKNT
jgi:hypothetical protein